MHPTVPAHRRLAVEMRYICPRFDRNAEVRGSAQNTPLSKTAPGPLRRDGAGISAACSNISRRVVPKRVHSSQIASTAGMSGMRAFTH